MRGNVTYFARWVPTATATTNFTVTFNPNGGTVNPITRTVQSGAAVGTLPTPTRAGHRFDGWFTAVTGGTRVTASTVVRGNVTYFARWTAVPRTPPPPQAFLDTIGISIGTSFSTPLLIVTVHGTYGFAPNWFIGGDIDLGLIPVAIDDAEPFYYERYFSLCFFANIGYFVPFRTSGGWYMSLGVGYFLSRHTFSDGRASFGTFVLDLGTGFIIGDQVILSYTLRTNFSGVTNKLSIGLIHRF